MRGRLWWWGAGALLSLLGGALAGLACLSNPCVHGVCIDDLNSTYSCYCIDGYTGIECQTNWDECWSDPCQNGGSCIDGIAEYNCTCPEGYIGLNCEEDFDECDSNPCQNNGTCQDAPNGYECLCLPGYSGIHCEMDMAVCNLTEETRCDNGAQCVEGHGMSFSCRCTPGWEGKLCNLPINECASSPCQNGGLCIDQHADYICACSFGYTGKRCESQIELCSNNPCINNALCMMEDTIKVCYCVPDYHGEKCQFQYDECLLGPKCMNGGTCIDGVDNFTCSCPPMLTGLLCECLILDNDDLDCEYVSPSPMPDKYDLSSVTPTLLTITHSSTFRETPQSTTDRDTTITEDTSSKYETTLFFTDQKTSVTNVPTFTWDQSTFTTLDNSYSISTSSQSSAELSTGSTSLSTEITKLISESTDVTLSTDLTTINQVFLSSITPQFFNQSTSQIFHTSSDYSSTDMTLRETTYSMPLTYTREAATAKEETLKSTYSTDLYTSTTEPTSIVNTEKSTDSITVTTNEATGEFESTTISQVSYSTEEEIVNETQFTKIFVPDDMKTDRISTSVSTESTDLTTLPILLTEESTVPSDVNTFKDTKMTFDIETTSEMSTLFTESPVTSFTLVSTSDSTTSQTYEFTSSSNIGPDCTKVGCLNGGTCVQSTEGPKCVCKFDFDGPVCEHVLGIASAAFSGDSYLTHKLYNMTGITVQLRARTLSSEGLILYANIGQDTYFCLYMQKGLLKFKFSCGYQTMLLSELEVPVDNGYELRIKAILELTDSRRHCNASLHINDTLAMSGGQVAAPSSYPPDRNSWLHLGAVADGLGVTDHSPPDIAPFTGCMMRLLIDGKPRHIFKDAVDGFEIKECSSLACLSSPCRNGGSCNDVGDRWTCSCANGYLGHDCTVSVCNVNPCQFGGTCVRHPGSGYLCLCPLGKHGLFCEHNLDIAQPSFSPMVGGLSSFAAYPLPLQLISHGLEIHFKIKPHNMDQIALLAFLGQSGLHDPKSDHLAVTFVKGYIMLTWNLGNGPRRIFTTRPIMTRGNRPHIIRIGRLGRSAWLSVDTMPNITGNAPGNLQQLNVIPLLYLGGHESANFSVLPHDLPLHGGFSGCIFDLWLRGGGGAGVPWAPVKGRAVGQCSVTQCHPMLCNNGGACLHHAATYSCLCSDGWFGPLCNNQRNPCDSTVHNCSNGATCVPIVTGYQCDCPLGKTGVFCEKDVELSDVLFSGTRSYLKLTSIPMGDIHFSLDFEVRPSHPKGLLFYTVTHDGCFVSLSLQGGLLEYRWAGMEWGVRPGGRVVVVVRSGVVLSLGSWHVVRAGRYGRRLFLWVDGTMTTETLATHHSFSSFNTSVYIGGVKDLSTLPSDVMSGPPMSLTGCIRKLIINSQPFPLNGNHITDSRNIDDCDGEICGGDVCWNGGTCLIHQQRGRSMTRCICDPLFTGERCMYAVPCSEGKCHKGRCVQGMCICPTGWNGHFCQNQLKMGMPQFSGNSFMVIDESKLRKSDKQSVLEKYRFRRSINNVYMNFTTAQPNGLLLWGEMENKKYVSIGLEGGYLKLSWTLLKPSRERKPQTAAMDDKLNGWPHRTLSDTVVIKVIQAGRFSNGEWHTLQLEILPGNITLVTDNKKVYEESGGKYEMKNSDVTLYIGGFPVNVSTAEYTRGLYSSNFVGCVSSVSFGPDNYTIKNFSHFESENVDTCKLFS